MLWKLRFEDRPGTSLCIVEKDKEILGAFRCSRGEYDEFKTIFTTGLDTIAAKLGSFSWPNQMKQKL